MSSITSRAWTWRRRASHPGLPSQVQPFHQEADCQALPTSTSHYPELQPLEEQPWLPLCQQWTIGGRIKGCCFPPERNVSICLHLYVQVLRKRNGVNCGMTRRWSERNVETVLTCWALTCCGQWEKAARCCQQTGVEGKTHPGHFDTLYIYITCTI